MMCVRGRPSGQWPLVTTASVLLLIVFSGSLGATGQAIENQSASNLTLHRFYTLNKASSRIVLTANGNITEKLAHSKKEIVFDFRTRYPNSILFHESFYANTTHTTIYNLWLLLQNSRLKVMLECDGKKDVLLIGHGFNRDYVHRVHMYMNLQMGFFNIRINSTDNGKHYKSLYFNSSIVQSGGPYSKFNYQLILGGHHNHSSVTPLPIGYPNFIGCIGNLNIVSRSPGNNFGTLASSHLELAEVQPGCVDLCNKLNLCSQKSRCINYYDYKECDCFGTELEDWQCRSYNYTVITLRGYSAISYRIYQFEEKTYSNENLVSLNLKTNFDGLLFVALAEMRHSYLILNIKNGFLNLLFNVENNPKNYIFNDVKLVDNQWHNVTVVHRNRRLIVHIDSTIKHMISLEESNFYFCFDPEIFFGGLPSSLNISQLNLPLHMPHKRFVGCFKHLHFNNINVLYNLNSGHKDAKYYSLYPLELGCSDISSVPITIQAKSYVILPINQTNQFDFEFKFKSVRVNFQIANGTFATTDNGDRLWRLWIRNEDVKLSVESLALGTKQISWTLSNDNSLNMSEWNMIRIVGYSDGFIQMSVNGFTVKGRYDHPVARFQGYVAFGSIGDESTRFVGCARDIRLNGHLVEPRTLHERGMVLGSVTMDNCRLIDPCDRPNACYHGGTCIPMHDNGTYICDCSSTGYTGKTCYFSLYRKSCEEVYLMDKQHSGIYMIDIDRNGPLPPAHVVCDVKKDNADKHLVRTVVEHNIQHQVIVREKGRKGHFLMDVIYRDFNTEMLQLLISRTKRCQQYVRYECMNAPLSLSTYTLLYSTFPDHKVVRLDSSRPKGCLCGGSPNVCVDPTKNCNCDASFSGWNRDEGYLTQQGDVGITKMYFLEFPNITVDSEAHLFLGNLSCIDQNTQQYEITFKTKESYLEVQGWKGREMGISFRTTANKAVIFYQSHLDTVDTYFKAVIISENEVSFEYSLRNHKHVITVSSSHCLNCGQWQHIWIERNHNQMRVSINQNFKILYLNENEHFIDFDGKLYVGGAPLSYLKGLKITLGFIGCLRGLVFDDEVVNLHAYLYHYNRYINIETGCRPYCKPNLCQNQGVCIELWGSYQCKCANPIAHSGRNCEININENSLTLKKASFIRKSIANHSRIKAILKEDIILSFRTHSTFALLLYVHDTNNNFVQLNIQNGSNVVFTCNFNNRIIQRTIMINRNLLISGQPIQVKIDRRNKNNTVFTVNKSSLNITYPVKLLKEPLRHKWQMGQQFETIKLNLTFWNESGIFIGGISDIGAPVSMPGFVGCIQGLVLGSEHINLEHLAVEVNSKLETNASSSAVKAGCEMLCDQMPCKNGGICTEDWENEATKCDCENTSYRGDLCNTDIGALFEKNSSVVYYLDNVILDFTTIDIAFAFSTSHHDSATLFLFRYANSTRYLHIALFNNGKLLIEEDNGHEFYHAVIESEEDNYSDSYRHWVRYSRNGRNAEIIADSIIYEVTEHYRETPRVLSFTSDNIILIGSNRIQNHNFTNFSNFRGCISNLNVMLDNVKIDPFESAFGIRSGLSKVKVFGNIKQGVCASFRTHRESVALLQIEQTLTLTNREEIWLNRPKPNLIPYKIKNIFDDTSTFPVSSLIITLCSIYLTLVIIFVAVYLWKIDKRYKLLKFRGETPFFHKTQLKYKKNYAM